jgi:hypothetical protein
MTAKIQQLEAEIARLREALAPFAAVGSVSYRDEPEDRVVSVGRWHTQLDGSRPYADVRFTVADFHRATNALRPQS